jgi:hypothetical protein
MVPDIASGLVTASFFSVNQAPGTGADRRDPDHRHHQ